MDIVEIGRADIELVLTCSFLSNCSTFIDFLKDPMYVLDLGIEAFRRSAAKYKAKYHKPAVLILDDISVLARKHPDVIEELQYIAKDVADKEEFTFIFVASEGTIPNLMSRACRLLSVILFMFLPRLC